MKIEAQTRRILIVDDEPGIVAAVQRELRQVDSGPFRYQFEAYTDPLQALERARVQPFDAVISDYRMPGMDGLTLLKALAKLQPDCARIVLSGQTDLAALVRMINETHIYRFIPKPWQDITLQTAVAQALEYSATLLEHKRLATLMPPPEASSRLEAQVDDIDLVLIVDADPGTLASLSRALTQRSRLEGLYAAMRSEIPDGGGAALDEHRISVQVSPSSAYALKMAETVDFACIIANCRLPEIDGIELLGRFAELQPDCTRILLSDAVASSQLVQAIAHAHIFAYLEQPSDFDLKTTLALALAHRRLLIENRRLATLLGG